VALPFSHGVPGPLHDWSWPLWRPEFSSLPHTYSSMWLDQGLGSENFRRAWSPNIISVATLGLLFGPRIGLVVYIAFSFFVGVLAAYAMARTIGAATATAIVAAVIYATSPVIIYRVFAGHSFFWLGYECLPLVGYAICSLDSRVAIALVTFILSLDTPVPKLLVVALIFTMLCSYVFKHPKALWSIPLTLGCAAPTFAAVIYGWTAGGLASVLRTFPMWEQNNSLAGVGALRGIGYFTQTFEHAVPWESQLWVDITFGVALFFIIGSIYRRTRASVAVSILSLLGYVLITAATGPWQGLFLTLYDRGFFSVFRDPYDFATFLSLSLLLAIAVIARKWWHLVLASCLLADQLWATIFGFYSMPRITLPEAAIRGLEAIADTPGNGHILYIPVVGRQNTATEGSETWPTFIGTHGTLNSYFDEGIVWSTTRYLSDRSYPPSSVLAASGVQWVVLRPGSPDWIRERFLRDRAMRLFLGYKNIQFWYNAAYHGRMIANWPCSSPLLFLTLIEIEEGHSTSCTSWSLPAQQQGYDVHIYNNWIPYRAGFPHDPVPFEAGLEAGVATLGARSYQLPAYLPPYTRFIAAGDFHVEDQLGAVRLSPCGAYCRVAHRSLRDGHLYPKGPAVIWGFQGYASRSTRGHFQHLFLVGDRLAIETSSLANMSAAGWRDGAGPLLVSHRSYRNVLFGGFLYNLVPMFICLASWLFAGVMALLGCSSLTRNIAP
jgi:hypothetical protein